MVAEGTGDPSSSHGTPASIINRWAHAFCIIRLCHVLLKQRTMVNEQTKQD